MLKPLAVLAALVALTAFATIAAVTALIVLIELAVPSANAAALSPSLNIHASGISTMTVQAGRTPGYGYGSTPPAPAYPGPRPSRGGFTSNQFNDSTGNLSPGGGGGGSPTPTVKKPKLQ